MPTIVASLTDVQGRVSRKEFHLDASITTVAAAQTAMDALVAAWPGVSDAGMSEAHVTFPLTLTPIAPVVDSNIDEGARISLAMTSGVGRENYRIPAPAKTAGVFDYITGGVVDTTNAALVAYFDLFEAGGNFRIGVNALRAVANLVSGYLERR
jgi:hypothetical protein